MLRGTHAIATIVNLVARCPKIVTVASVSIALTVAIIATGCNQQEDTAAISPTASVVSAETGLASRPTMLGQTPSNGTIPYTPPPRSNRPVFEGDAGDVERAFRASLDAYERKDVEAVLALHSSTNPDAAPYDRDDLAEFVEAYRIVLYRINDITVTGATAVINYENAIVGRKLALDVTTLLAQRDVWAKEGSGWVHVSNVNSAPRIPSDLASAPLTLRDEAQIVVGSLPRTEFAFAIKNTGAEQKGVFILGIPADLDVPSFIDRQTRATEPGFAEDILEMGATPEVAAGGDGAMVFNAALPPGRYLLLTTMGSDGDRTLRPAEYAEFTIPAG